MSMTEMRTIEMRFSMMEKPWRCFMLELLGGGGLDDSQRVNGNGGGEVVADKGDGLGGDGRIDVAGEFLKDDRAGGSLGDLDGVVKDCGFTGGLKGKGAGWHIQFDRVFLAVVGADGLLAGVFEGFGELVGFLKEEGFVAGAYEVGGGNGNEDYQDGNHGEYFHEGKAPSAVDRVFFHAWVYHKILFEIGARYKESKIKSMMWGIEVGVDGIW